MNMFSSQPIQYTLKYIMVGDSCVGKSCLLLQLTHDKFEHMHDITIGVEFGTYNHILDNGTLMKLQIWDTAGQESFRSITRSYYRGSICGLVVFDITNNDSFKHASGWIRDVKINNPSITLMLIGNKSDLAHRRAVTYEDAEKFAKENDMVYIETSAKTGQNVRNAFINSIPQIYKMIEEGKLENVGIVKVTGPKILEKKGNDCNRC